MNVGDRVKCVRRGCRPDYGVVVQVSDPDPESGDQWLLIDWDHGVRSHASSTELRRVVIDRSPRNSFKESPNV